MLDIICKKNKNMEVSNYELKDKLVYTYQTLDYFRNKYSKDEIYFICGTDNLTYMDKWENGTDILSYNKILVIKRETDDYEDILNRLWEYKDNIILTDIKPYKISSTIIRDMINKGDSNIDNYLDKDVIAYIKENKLYILLEVIILVSCIFNSSTLYSSQLSLFTKSIVFFISISCKNPNVPLLTPIYKIFSLNLLSLTILKNEPSPPTEIAKS